MNKRVGSSASLSALSATNSDTECGERPVREQLKKTTIAALPGDALSTSDHPMGDAPNHAKATKGRASKLEDDGQSNSESDRGRLRRKRSFEVFEGDHSEEKPTDKPERHTRKKSRDIGSSHSGPDASARKSSGESSVSRIDEYADEPMKSTESNGADDSTLSQEMDTKSPATPTGSDSTNKEEGMVISPKNKRTRDEYLQGQDKEMSSLVGEANKVPRAEKTNSDTVPSGTFKEERNPKRHRDSNSPKLSGGEEEKPRQTKIPPGSGFSNSSAQSPFAALSGNKSPKAQPQTSSSAFKASGFGAFASQPSPLGALGGSKSPSPFGSQTSSIKSTSVFGASPKTKPSEGGFAALSSPGKSVFGNSGTNTLGGGKVSFGGTFGGSFGGGFGGLAKGGISSFATSGGSSITGLSDKPAKPFGAAEDEEEEEGSGSEDHEDGDTKAQQTEEVKKDRRFYEQEVETGEEDEETMFTARAKLFSFIKGDGWKERGVGNLKLNTRKRTHEEEKSNAPKKARFIMRAEGSHRVVLNSPIHRDLKVGDPKGEKPTAGMIYFLGSLDKERAHEMLLLRMKSPNAEELFKRITELRKEM